MVTADPKARSAPTQLLAAARPTGGALFTVALSVRSPVIAAGLQAILQDGDIECVDEAEAADVLATDDLPVPQGPRVLYAVQEAPCAQVLELLRAGIAGVMLLDREPVTVLAATYAVASGGIWLDPCSAIAGELVVAAFRGSRLRGPWGLSVQQLRVLRHVARGATNRQVGDRLGISPETVKNHLSDAMRAMGAYDRLHAAALFEQTLSEGFDPSIFR
ncbi:MAG: response regulator transcription factor [Actinobacteria bacterium]|nr:response regulator transcription factor [Actinomycetota bacterium]